MVLARSAYVSPAFVPAEYLYGACCLLPERSPAGAFSSAERSVFALLRAGCSNKEIAAVLGKAEPTVKHQVSSILRKSGAQSRCQLLARFPAWPA